MKTRWVCGAAIAASILLAVASGAFVFDRNGDGVDDGGLDLSLATAVVIALSKSFPLISADCTLPPLKHSRASAATPRAPPAPF